MNEQQKRDMDLIARDYLDRRTERGSLYLYSDRYGVATVGPEGDLVNTADVWHTEAVLLELGERAWLAVFGIFAW